MRQARRRLFTIPVSHYCEKARWALDRAALPYDEHRHVQIFHYAATVLHGRSLYAPLLLTESGPITDSTDILHYADRHVPAQRRLFPDERRLAERVEAWEEELDQTLGVEARRWLYLVSFEQLEVEQVCDFIAQGTPRWQRFAAKLLMPAAKLYLRARLGVNADAVARGLEQLRRLFDRVDAELSDGRPYLVGDRFTAADLALASLSALLLLPKGYGVRLFERDELPASARQTVVSFRETPTGRHVMRLFAEERPPPAEYGKAESRAPHRMGS